MKKEVSNEVISAFLEGSDPQKYIVAIEVPYFNNIASLIVNDPVEGKYIQRVMFQPFLWMKHDVVDKIYKGDRDKIKKASENLKIKFLLLTTEAEDGLLPTRMDNGYKYMAKCDGPYTNLITFFKEGGVDPFSKDFREFFMTISPTEQFLIQTGKRLFKGMEDYDDLHRMQFDLETSGLTAKGNTIFQIGIRDNRGFEHIIEVEGDDPKILREREREAIKQLFYFIDELKPDVITGYNSEAFDWDFIIGRCAQLSIDIKEFAKGLDGSPLFRKESSLKLGGESESFSQTNLWGYSVLDASHAVRRAQAINSDIKLWNLKYITQYSRVAKANRVYVPGNILHTTWKDTDNQYIFNDTNGDWTKYNINNQEHTSKLNEGYELVSGAFIVRRYLLDDLWETEKVDGIYNQATFLLSKLIPTSFTRSSTMGTAGIWKLIMMAWSYENNLGIPQTQPQKTFTGGLSRLLEVGFAKNVAKLDYAALYPNTELTHGIFPDVDITGAMRGLLLYIAETRDISKELKGIHGDKAKAIEKELEAIIEPTSKQKEDMLTEIKYNTDLSSKYDKKQLPIKILANSFFGSLGAPHIFPWGDTFCAEETTCRGRQYLRLMVSHFHGVHRFRPLVGDSVTYDTPVYIKHKISGLFDILPICDLFTEISLDIDGQQRDISIKDYEILTRSGWKTLDYVYRHKTNKKIFDLRTKDRHIRVTEDHSIFQNNIKVLPSNLNIGDSIDIYEIPTFNNINNISINKAWLLGFFVGDGSSVYCERPQKYKSRKTGNINVNKGKRAEWTLNNLNLELLEKSRVILKEEFGVDALIKDYLKSSGTNKLKTHNAKLSLLFSTECYTSYRQKKVPNFILNATDEIKKSFLDGFICADGNGFTVESSQNIYQKSLVCLGGLAYLHKSLGIEHNIGLKKQHYFERGLMGLTINTPKIVKHTVFNEILWKEEYNNGDEFVYDVSTEDGSFVAGINGVSCSNTDGFNFAIPDSAEDFYYDAIGSHKLTKEFAGQRINGLKAVVAEFNEVYMEGRMGLDIDDICSSTLNFSRKNYANDINGKIKLVGNTIKSKKMPVYIEEFINAGVRLLLDGKGFEFINLYHDTVDNIVNYNIPLSKIASKARVKQTLKSYYENCKKKNKAGNPMPRQAHMELAIQHQLDINLGDTIYYVNTGSTKSHGDIKSNKLPNGQVQVDLMCKLIPTEQLESNPNLTTDEYNAVKYLAAFNTRIHPLLVCFNEDIRDKIVLQFTKSKVTKLLELNDKNIFTIKECELVSGMPFNPSDQDRLIEDLMDMEDKELDFWCSVDKEPNHIDLETWPKIKADHIIRRTKEREEGIALEKEQLIELFRKLEVDDFDLMDNFHIPMSLHKIVTIEPIFAEGTDNVIDLMFKSIKWDLNQTSVSHAYEYRDDAIIRAKYYAENNDYDYGAWYNKMCALDHQSKVNIDKIEVARTELINNPFNPIVTDDVKMVIDNSVEAHFLLANGWYCHGGNDWVKSEWMTESERLGLRPEQCPNWYHTETLQSAYEIATNEKYGWNF